MPTPCQRRDTIEGFGHNRSTEKAGDSAGGYDPEHVAFRSTNPHSTSRGPRKIGEEVRRAVTAKSSDMEIGSLGKRFGRGQTYPERAKIRSDRGENSELTACLRRNRTERGIIKNSM